MLIIRLIIVYMSFEVIAIKFDVKSQGTTNTFDD